jgi:hypothetical protein
MSENVTMMVLGLPSGWEYPLTHKTLKIVDPRHDGSKAKSSRQDGAVRCEGLPDPSQEIAV